MSSPIYLLLDRLASYTLLASSPGHSHIFNVTRALKKIGETGDEANTLPPLLVIVMLSFKEHRWRKQHAGGHQGHVPLQL